MHFCLPILSRTVQNPYQSGFCHHHSTENNLVKFTNCLHISKCSNSQPSSYFTPQKQLTQKINCFFLKHFLHLLSMIPSLVFLPFYWLFFLGFLQFLTFYRFKMMAFATAQQEPWSVPHLPSPPLPHESQSPGLLAVPWTSCPFAGLRAKALCIPTTLECSSLRSSGAFFSYCIQASAQILPPSGSLS